MISPEVKAKAYHLWKAGRTGVEIAKEFGLPKSTVYRWIESWRMGKNVPVAAPEKAEGKAEPKGADPKNDGDSKEEAPKEGKGDGREEIKPEDRNKIITGFIQMGVSPDEAVAEFERLAKLPKNQLVAELMKKNLNEKQKALYLSTYGQHPSQHSSTHTGGKLPEDVKELVERVQYIKALAGSGDIEALKIALQGFLDFVKDYVVKQHEKGDRESIAQVVTAVTNSLTTALNNLKPSGNERKGTVKVTLEDGRVIEGPPETVMSIMMVNSSRESIKEAIKEVTEPISQAIKELREHLPQKVSDEKVKASAIIAKYDALAKKAEADRAMAEARKAEAEAKKAQALAEKAREEYRLMMLLKLPEVRGKANQPLIEDVVRLNVEEARKLTEEVKVGGKGEG